MHCILCVTEIVTPLKVNYQFRDINPWKKKLRNMKQSYTLLELYVGLVLFVSLAGRHFQ